MKAWGVCRVVRQEPLENLEKDIFSHLRNSCNTWKTFQEGMTVPEPVVRRVEGLLCESNAQCQAHDVNLVCRFVEKNYKPHVLIRPFLSGKLLLDLEIVQLLLCQLQRQLQLVPVVRI